VSCAI